MLDANGNPITLSAFGQMLYLCVIAAALLIISTGVCMVIRAAARRDLLGIILGTVAFLAGTGTLYVVIMRVP